MYHCAGVQDGEPENAANVAMGVLYSGDYASSKKSQLIKTLERVVANQRATPVPAALSFIPDA